MEAKYEIGDRVKLKNRRGFGWNIEGKMDKYMGAEVVISEFKSDQLFKAEGINWFFHTDNIERRVFNKNDLRTGDVVQYQSGERSLVLQIPEVGGQLQRKLTYVTLDIYENDLTHKFLPSMNIVKVYRPIRHVALFYPRFIDDSEAFEVIWSTGEKRYYLIDEFMSTKGGSKYLTYDPNGEGWHLSSERDSEDYQTKFTMEEIKKEDIPLNRFRLVPVKG